MANSIQRYIAQMFSASVASQHNDVKGMLVPENSNLPYGQFQVLTYAFR